MQAGEDHAEEGQAMKSPPYVPSSLSLLPCICCLVQWILAARNDGIISYMPPLMFSHLYSLIIHIIMLPLSLVPLPIILQVLNFLHHGFMTFAYFQEHNTHKWCVLYIDILPLLLVSYAKVGNSSKHQNNRLAHNLATFERQTWALDWGCRSARTRMSLKCQ